MSRGAGRAASKRRAIDDRDPEAGPSASASAQASGKADRAAAGDHDIVALFVRTHRAYPRLVCLLDRWADRPPLVARCAFAGRIMPPRKPKSPGAIENLLSILDLEPLEDNLFRGRSPQQSWQRVFGGQTLGQALVAAVRTVPPERIAHSLHAYFLQPGDLTRPIIYGVERVRDGGSFTTRRVTATQHGRAMFVMSVSFHKVEPGLDHQNPCRTCRRPRTCRAKRI